MDLKIDLTVEQLELNEVTRENSGIEIKLNGSSSSENHLHPQDNHDASGSSSPTAIWDKRGSSASQSSLEFGKGERRSPSPSRSINMLKHATTSSSPNAPIAGGVKSTPQPQKVQKVSSSSLTSNGPDINIKLPQRFVVKYLGFRETSNLWGIKYTRRPVDEMVTDAKKILATNPEQALALLRLEVSEEGIVVGPMPQNTNPNFPNGKYAIESISYGVQDLVYTRVFAMIVVKTDGSGQSEVKLSQLVNLQQQQSSNSNGSSNGGALPFRCHAFVCDSRQTARRLTYSLASAFEIFSKKVASGKITAIKPKKFAIDLRPAEEIEKEMADSEA